ncbi:MAG: DMT family transporter [Candidatus Saccharimonadales bacterium]
MSWFYLALLAPLLYAIVTLLDDNLLSFVYKSPYLATMFAGFFGAVPLIALAFKTPAAMPFSLGSLALLAGFLTVAYYFFYFKGLEADSPSIVIALFSLSPATIPFLAYFFVHERLHAMQLVGFLIVLLASLCLAVTDIKKFKFSKALLPVAIAVVFMDAVSILTKHVYQHANFYPAYMYFCAGMGLGGGCFFLLKYEDNQKGLHSIRKSIKKLLPVFIAAELMNLAAEFTLNLAISRGPVSLVKVIEGIQPMFVLLIALVLYPLYPKFFREAEEGQRTKKFALMGMAIIGLGIISKAANI